MNKEDKYSISEADIELNTLEMNLKVLESYIEQEVLQKLFAFCTKKEEEQNKKQNQGE